MLTVIRTSGEITELKPKGKKVSLEEMQKVVGGYIEMVTLKNKVLICNEEGKLMNLPLNERRMIMEEQAQKMILHYQQNIEERQNWQSGEFSDEY